MEDTREPDAVLLLHSPGHFNGASHRGESPPELVTCLLFCFITHVHTDEKSGAQAESLRGKSKSKSEAVGEQGKSHCGAKITSLTLFVFRQFLIRVINCDKFDFFPPLLLCYFKCALTEV